MTAEHRLASVLRAMGVRRGGILMVHASLGGSGLRAADLLGAVFSALGPEGTLVVPAFTPENSDTSHAHRALTQGMAAGERARYLASMPPFDPATTPCRGMGVFAEYVRTTAGAVRSAHPQTSLAGIGPRAVELLADHAVDCHLGERSPLGRLYTADTQVLLFRVGFEVCSALHLAEYRLPAPPTRTYRCVVGRTGNWLAYEDVALNDGDFAEIGALLPRELLVERDVAGRPTTLFSMRVVVDAARDQMSGFRQGLA